MTLGSAMVIYQGTAVVQAGSPHLASYAVRSLMVINSILRVGMGRTYIYGSRGEHTSLITASNLAMSLAVKG